MQPGHPIFTSQERLAQILELNGIGDLCQQRLTCRAIASRKRWRIAAIAPAEKLSLLIANVPGSRRATTWQVMPHQVFGSLWTSEELLEEGVVAMVGEGHGESVLL